MKLRFTLRTLLLAITALGIWLGLQVSAARQQKEAVDALLKVNAHITYDYQWVQNPKDPSPFNYKLDRALPIPGPHWLRKLTGDDFFRTVAQVELTYATYISESDLAQLAKLPAVRELDFPAMICLADGTFRNIGDDDLKVLENLTKLKILSFDDCSGVHADGMKYLSTLRELEYLGIWSLNDVAMEYIGKLTSLKELNAAGIRLTSKGFQHLQFLVNLTDLSLPESEFSDADAKYIASTHLKGLWINDTKIGDVGIQHICQLSNGIQILQLVNTQITDAGMPVMRNLQSLRYLDLSNTKITDAGLSVMSDLQSLRYLELGGTGVSDAGLQYLSGLKNLQKLYVGRTKVTPNGARELKKSLPALVVNGVSGSSP